MREKLKMIGKAENRNQEKIGLNFKFILIFSCLITFSTSCQYCQRKVSENMINDFKYFHVNEDINLKIEIIDAYYDSLASIYNWDSLPNSVIEYDIPSRISYKRYFLEKPDEILLANDLSIHYVYNQENGWINQVTKDQQDRIIKRFKEEVIAKYVEAARNQGLHDSLIFYPEFDY